MKKILFLDHTKSLISICMLVITTISFSSHAKQNSNEADKSTKVIRSEWTKPYAEIHKFLKAGQFNDALLKVELLSRSENITQYELFSLDRTKAAIGAGSKNKDLMNSSVEKLVGSDFLGSEDKLKFLQFLANESFNEKKYSQAKKWAEEYLLLNKENRLMQDLLLKSNYELGKSTTQTR